MVYTRTYAGPLQPGKVSAYVPGLRRNKRRFTKKTAAAYIQRKWRNRPSRLTASRTRYIANRAVSKAMRNYGENKFNGNHLECLAPRGKFGGSQPIMYILANTGKDITSRPEFRSSEAMDLYDFPKGDGPNDRTGDYIYLRQTHMKMEVQMLPGTSEIANSINQNIEFRLVVFKANRKVQGYGGDSDPGNSLFLDEVNQGFGYDSTIQTPYQYMNQPINKRQWLVYCDKKFTLSPPAYMHHDDDNNTSNTKLPKL